VVSVAIEEDGAADDDGTSGDGVGFGSVLALAGAVLLAR